MSEERKPGDRLQAAWEAIDRDELAAAEAIARNALRSNPRDVEATYLLGSSLLFQDRYQEALAPLQQAYQEARRKGAGHRLGYCYLALGDFKNAELVLAQEIEAYPDLVNARNALGIALVRQSRREEALAVFLEAARLDPGSVESNNNVGNVLGDLRRYEEAIPYLRKVLDANPDLAETHHNLGLTLQSLKRHEEAIASLQAALRLAPGASFTLSHLVWNQLSICQWQDLEARVDALRTQVRTDKIAAEPFTFVAISRSAEEQQLCTQIYIQEKFPRRPKPLWRETRYRHGRIRLAYLSADFREHATAYLSAGLFELHDRSKFEVFGISYGPDDRSAMRSRLKEGFDRFLDVRGKSDEDTARMLRDMEVDIAIDLHGHTIGTCLGILAHRPAPVQSSYLGFPGTTGAEFIDYLLADRIVLPEEQQQFCTEKVVYLPDCYQVNDAKRPIAERAPTREEAGLPRAGVVFCCFNNNYKITPDVFAIWMRLLHAVPGSVLWLLEDNSVAKRNLLDRAQSSGVDATRLVFAARLPNPQHLARHRLADLFLDTQPCNAHTTASDALWTGVPVLTCAGNTFAGRVASSLLAAVGLPELVTHSLEDYETLALRLAKDGRRLEELRSRLTRSRATAPLFDTDRFRRHIEAAYVTMWEIQQRGEPPTSFAVDPVS